MDDQNKGEIIMYQTEDGLTEIQTTLINDTVWLSANQMAELFQRDEKTIRKHINGELSRENNARKMRVVLGPFPFGKSLWPGCRNSLDN